MLTLLFSSSANALIHRPLGQSPKGLLMGDAYTALATDEFTLFYNPALLARNKGLSFYPFNPSITLINALKDADKFSDVGTDPGDIADSFLGTPIHIGLNVAPGFKLGRFGVSGIINYDSNLQIENKVSPVLDIDHRYDNGFIMGYAFPLRGSLNMGFSAKYLKRESILKSFYLMGTSLLDALSAGEQDAILEQLGLVNGSGWGFDLGFDYAPSESFSMGLSIMDLYTLLHTNSNEDDLEVHTQPMKINFGAAYVLGGAGGFDIKVSADIKHLESQIELMRRIHMGVEVALSPVISVLGGLHSTSNYSYGLKANFGLIKTYLGFFSEEIGEKLGQKQSDRILFYISLFHFDFDPGI